MKPDEYFAWLESEFESIARESLIETTQQAAGMIRKRIPGSRRKTKNAVQNVTRKTSRGFQSRIRLRFSKHYRTAGTETERIFRREWRRVRPGFTQHFTTTLSSKLKRI